MGQQCHSAVDGSRNNVEDRVSNSVGGATAELSKGLVSSVGFTDRRTVRCLECTKRAGSRQGRPLFYLGITVSN